MSVLSNFKITIFGDSISKGIGIKESKLRRIENSAVHLLEKYYDIQIENQSVFGQTLTKIEQRELVDKYLENLDEKTKRNCVVFSIGGNDSDYNWAEVANAPRENHLPNTPIDEFARKLNGNVRKLQKRGVNVFLTTLPPIHSDRYLDNISKIADRTAIMEFFNNDVTIINRHQECYNNEIVKCAIKNRCGLIDIRPPFLLNRHFLDYMCEDGIHPNELGQEEIAKNIIDIIDHNKMF